MTLRKNIPLIFILTVLLSPLHAQVLIPLATGTPEEIVASIDEVVANKNKTKAVVGDLIKALGQDDADVRVRERAAWALGQLKVASAVKPLMQAAQHKSLLIRSAALNSLMRLRASAALPTYIEIATSDPILSLRERATIALGLLQSEKTIDTLVKLSEDPREEVRSCAVLAMAATHSKKNNFSEIAKEMAADPSPYVQERAKKALEIIQGNNSVIYPQLSSEDVDVRLVAALFFRNDGTEADLKTLKDAQNGDSDEDIRDELGIAIKAIEKRVADKRAAEKRAAEKKAQAAKAKAEKQKASTPKPAPKK